MTTPKILALKQSRYWDLGNTTRLPNQPRNVKTMCVFAKPTGKVGLVKANPKG